MINDWKECLLERAPEWGLPRSGEWRFLFYNNYHPQCSDIDVLWFHEAERFPRVVTKVSREPGRPEREYANLEEVYDRAPEWVPKPLHFGALGKFWLLWMQGLPGGRFSGKHTPQDLRLMAGAVSAIHKAVSRGSASASRDRAAQMVTAPLEALAGFGGASPVRDGCRRLAARAGGEWIHTLPVVPQHGDLYDGNLLRDGDRCYAVDWESFGMVDLPMYDLWTLLLSLLRGAGKPKQSAEWSPELVRQMPALVKQYADGVGLATDRLPVLLPLAMANWFHVHWRDGRVEFCQRLYETIKDYFENESSWEKVFFTA